MSQASAEAPPMKKMNSLMMFVHTVFVLSNAQVVKASLVDGLARYEYIIYYSENEVCERS